MLILRWLTALVLLLAVHAWAGTAVKTSQAAPPAQQGTLVLVAGASGDTGQHIVRTLLAEGYQVRALTTNAFRARERTGLDIDWVEFDVRDAEQVLSVMEGVDYVISAIGSRDWRGPNSPRYVDFGGVRNLVDAARSEGVQHFVLISSAAAGPHRDHSESPRLGYVLYWKTRGENHLRASGLDYTIIGPGGLVNGPAARSGIRITSRADYRRGLIARADVARLATASLTAPSARNKSFAAVNDDELGPDHWIADLRALAPDAQTEATARNVAEGEQ
ncbi:MAG: SDR family oxidoreductase [Gammaproteobacteria bacterium]|nr:SDR family oxidoreductase [Gammaproteobacteria bacterium]